MRGAGWLCDRPFSREDDSEFAALPRRTIEFDVTAERAHGALNDRQAESRSAGGAIAGRVDAVETLEDAGLVLGGDSDAGVANPQNEVIAPVAQLDPDRSARRG